jgi:large conductance mechanosensitive channel
MLKFGEGQIRSTRMTINDVTLQRKTTITMSLIKEFRDFINKGNVVDLAVGVVIGAAFGKIVASLVDHMIMPPIGKLLGGVDFADFALDLGLGADGKPVLLQYGLFINAIINFLIVAFAIFLFVKMYNRMKRREEAAPPPPPTKEVVLLTEIRDALRARN